MFLISSLRNFSILDCGSHITYHRNKYDYRLPSKYWVVLDFKDIILYTNMQVIYIHTYIIFKYMFIYMKGKWVGWGTLLSIIRAKALHIVIADILWNRHCSNNCRWGIDWVTMWLIQYGHLLLKEEWWDVIFVEK